MDCMRNNFVDGVLLDGRFRTVAPLNHGSFGMVFKAHDVRTGGYVALKCLTKANAAHIGGLAVDEQSEELAIHRRIDGHPNIIKLIHHFETEHHVYLVLEFCENGDLYEAIRIGHGPGRTQHIRQCMLELVGAVEHMHAHGVYHRDIKPENMMLCKDGSTKLGDFGLATTEAWSFEAAVGSDRYMAPEQYEPANVGYSPAQADVWAIGICLLNILFSRNPFAAPTTADPLFSDFAHDRQTLFDVFPKMSQDTFEVLTHCLALDPTKRSLPAVKDALLRAVSFTTDDETLDAFCADNTTVVTASANRQPLRTPSVSTPQIEHAGTFPWAKALAMSPAMRQLSTIRDVEWSESMLPPAIASDSDWYAVKPDNVSISSFVDSGLGVSLKSTDLHLKPETARFTRSQPMAIAGSMPVPVGRSAPSLSSIFGNKREMVSKSWSDLWDEDEEENALISDSEHEVTPPRVSRGPQAWKTTANGQATPRQGLRELKNPATMNNSRNRTPDVAEDHVSEHTGFVFEEHDSGSSTPMTPTTGQQAPSIKSAGADKWSALGDRRRAYPTPANSMSTPRKRSRAGSWRARAMDPRPYVRPALSFVNDTSITPTSSPLGVLHQHQRLFSTGRNNKDSIAMRICRDDQIHPWLMSKDWRRPASNNTVHEHDFLSGWRRGLHL